MYLKLREYWNIRLKEVNHLSWQLIADHNERPKSYTIIRRFLFELVDITGSKWLRSNKFIICFARVILKYNNAACYIYI